MDKELVQRVKAAVSLLYRAGDAVDDVYYAARQGSRLEFVTLGRECLELRERIIKAARADGLSDEDMGIGLPKSTANVTAP